uniref:Rho-GAP domain-containing protein n=1 Tax=Gouania willdenowi TaxID=441366 RepID=A0A8C5EHG3_GOUWI
VSEQMERGRTMDADVDRRRRRSLDIDRCVRSPPCCHGNSSQQRPLQEKTLFSHLPIELLFSVCVCVCVCVCVGNRDVLASPGSYLFLSNSAGQGDSWLQSLNKDLWIPFTGVFGQRLEETVLYEQRYGVRLIPVLVEQCVNFIRERGLQEVGLFHQPGCPSVVTELQEAFDSGERPSFNSSLDVHTVASLLMLYLSQLPEPLVPHTHFRDFLYHWSTSTF